MVNASLAALYQHPQVRHTMKAVASFHLLINPFMHNAIKQQ